MVAVALKIILAAIFAMLINGIVKFSLNLIKKKKFRFELLYRAYGGMPSGHAAFLSAICASIYFIEGLSILFGATAGICLLLIEDLRTVKWFHSNQHRILSYLLTHAKNKRKNIKFNDLTDKVGHNMPEIIVGVLIGIFSAFLILRFL